MQVGLHKAVAVPLGTMRLGDGCWDAMLEMAAHGNIASRSDLEVGARALEAGIWGAWRNVLINLPGIEDEAYRRQKEEEARALAERAAEQLADVLAELARR
jgi:glutamate formiminotransferase/formiminotetrahydrofolate cyclodeaminase